MAGAGGSASGLDVLALNVAAPTKETARGLLEYLWAADEPLVVLGEITRGEGSRLILDVCRAAGYDVLTPALSGRDRGVALVARDTRLPVGEPTFPAGPRVVRARIGQATVLGVYGAASDPVRYGSRAQRDRKRAWLREFVALVDAECRADASPLLLAGDLNIVDPADRAGLPYVLAQERDAYEHLLDLGLLDAHRHATGGSTPTWIDHSGVGCRYDHVFVRGLRVVSARVDDTPRHRGLSDHSAVLASLTT